MKTVNYIILSIFMAGLFLFSGCLSFHTHAVDIKPEAKSLNKQKYTVLGEAKGQSSSFNLLWFFPVTPRMSYKEAIDGAINDKGGDNLIDVRVWRERQFWLVGTIETLFVEGKVIRYTDSEY